MRYLYISILLVAIATIGTLPHPILLFAETSVVNNISIQANSGGNTAQNGEIIKGTTQSSVDITTVIDGETVEDIHESSSGTPIHIERTTTTHTGNATATTRIDMRGNTSQQVTAYDIQASRPDDTATTTEASSTHITNISEHAGTSTQEKEEMVHVSLFTRFITNITDTFAYVLSKLFTFS